MIIFALRRLLFSLVVLAGVLVTVFLISNAIGDPARLMLPVEAPEQQVQALREQLGLNDPIWEQFLRAAANWVQGDFGNSLWQQTPALGIVLQRVPATLLLTGATLIVAIPLALAIGVLTAVRPRSFVDRALTTLSLIGVSIADFWLALILILVFAVGLHWLPTSGYGGLSFLILPTITLMVRPMGRIAQVARASLIDEMGKQYPLTARSKGLSDVQVLQGHALRNSAIPIVTVIGAEAISLLNGAVVVETVFGWPGVGNLFIQAIQHRDLPLIQASVLVVALLVILVNLVVDLSYGMIDARVRKSGA